MFEELTFEESARLLRADDRLIRSHMQSTKLINRRELEDAAARKRAPPSPKQERRSRRAAPDCDASALRDIVDKTLHDLVDRQQPNKRRRSGEATAGQGSSCTHDRSHVVVPDVEEELLEREAIRSARDSLAASLRLDLLPVSMPHLNDDAGDARIDQHRRSREMGLKSCANTCASSPSAHFNAHSRSRSRHVPSRGELSEDGQPEGGDRSG